MPPSLFKMKDEQINGSSIQWIIFSRKKEKERTAVSFTLNYYNTHIHLFTWKMFPAAIEKEAIDRRMPPMTQLSVVANKVKLVGGWGFGWCSNNKATIEGPLYRVIMNAPAIDTRVPMILIWLIKLLKSTFSILWIIKRKLTGKYANTQSV